MQHRHKAFLMAEIQPHEHRIYYIQDGYKVGKWDGPLTPGYNIFPTQ